MIVILLINMSLLFFIHWFIVQSIQCGFQLSRAEGDFLKNANFVQATVHNPKEVPFIMMSEKKKPIIIFQMLQPVDVGILLVKSIKTVVCLSVNQLFESFQHWNKIRYPASTLTTCLSLSYLRNKSTSRQAKLSVSCLLGQPASRLLSHLVSKLVVYSVLVHSNLLCYCSEH